MKHNTCATMLALLLFGCTTGPLVSKPSVVKLAQRFTIITGTVAAPPKLMNNNKRLLVFLAEEPNPEKVEGQPLRDGDGQVTTDLNGTVVVPHVDKQVTKEVLMCVAENTDNKQVLANINQYLTDPKANGKPIIIYGKRLDSAWNEYVTGINCYINAISFYIPETGSYAIVTTDFGDGIFDTMDWKSFLVTVGKTAIKFAK